MPPKKRGRGQPTKLTADVLRRMVSARRCGLRVSEACKAVGIAPRLHRLWLARGASDAEAGKHSEYVDYLHRVTDAEAEGKWRRMRRVELAIRKGDATAIARAKLALQMEAQIDGGKNSEARRRVLRAALKGPEEAPASTEGQRVDLSHLDDAELAEFHQLSTLARADVTRLTVAQFARLQTLLKKARLGVDGGTAGV